MAQKVGLLFLQLLLNSSATDIVLVTLLLTAVETARGHCLNTSIVLPVWPNAKALGW